ncbi:Serine/threonine-protein kinase Nek10 [Porites harrisoni]
MPVEDKRERGQTSTALRDNEMKDLSRLLELLNTPASKQQLPSISWITDENQNSTPNPWAAQTHALPHQHQSTEALALEKFSSRYQSVRNFSSHTHQTYFTQIFTSLVKQRVCCLEWIERVPPENILRVLICLRMLMRDTTFQVEFFNLGGVKILSKRLQLLTESYLENGEEPFTVDILKEMTNICQKLSADVKQREWLVACCTHKALVLLLSANDVMVLHCSLYALIGLAQSERPRALIGELNSTEILLRILQEYDMLSKTLAAGLLRILCADSNIREQVKVFDGIPICLSLLHCDNQKLLWNVVWIIVQLAEDADASNDIRLLGGIPLLLTLLQDRKSISDVLYLGSDSSKASISADPADVEIGEETLSLKTAVCSALTELVVNDTNGQQIVQSNGIYLLGLLILPQETSSSEEAATVEHLQKSAFRALRFLFSMERNRQLFKRLFPPDLFEKFIDVGHYVRELNSYKVLVDKISALTEEDISVIRNNILATNQNKAPSHSIGSYEVLELLGSGAFGSVYKVRKKNAGHFLAMKELSVNNPALGKTAKDRGKSVGEILNETTIMKEQLRHPNVVKYHKAFQEKDKLYIIMELVEGAPLGEHFNSLKEKGTRFSEERIWHIFIQIVLGLRYIHKEKFIVHRDLTPNNIMLGENDKVTITDFGLAKQKNPEASKMTSMVGTILYSCPEVVQSQPYGEKADVWASGCILYQMATLQPPFYSSNMLALATKIVEAQYDPIPSGLYSSKVSETVTRCLNPNPEERPDIVEVAANISEIMLVYVDKLRSNEISLEKKLERERKRTQRHYIEATRNMQNYHRLFYASQERYDKLVNLSSSGGAAGFRTVDATEGSDTVFEAANALAELNLNKNGVYKNGETEHTPQVDSGIDVGDIHANGNLGSSAVNGEQNGGTKPGGSSSPGSTRRQRTLKPVVDKSSKGTGEKFTSNTKERDKTLQSVKGADKASNGRTIVDKTSVNSSTSNSHVFTVPKPPGPRKGPRRQLHVEFASSSKAGTSNGTSTHGVTHGVTPSATSASGLSDISSRRTQSSSSVEMQRRQAGGQLKARPPTAAATLSISPRKVRQINDPISQILNQLHKIIFITQLPPTLSPNPQRRIVEQFKRALFSPQNSYFVNLKSEVKKVIEGSREVIDLKFGFGDPLFLHHLEDTADKLVNGVNLETADAQEIGITYEMMQNIIENVLMESGYYDMSPCARNRTVPLGPIGTVPASGVNLGPSKRGTTS